MPELEPASAAAPRPTSAAAPRPTSLVTRTARPEDARALYAMVQAGDGLETNTNYAYLLLCDHFSETTLVAESDQMIVGFVAAYVLPKRPDTVFVWQVGVTPATRGRGIAGSLLDALRRSLARRRVRFLEATVTPDNTASRRLFESFANRCAADFAWSKGYDSALFLEQHASEQSIRVGPFPTLMSPKTPDRGSPE